MTGKKVAVAMSGGVDSSVAAALLVEQGYDVTGMMLRLWTEPGRETFNRCCTPEAMGLAKKVAAQLDIPFYAIDAKDTFHDTIVTYFMDGYASGATPNPCLMCNRHIRWEFLLNRALSMGADYMATGHYAQVDHEDGKPARLFQGVDNDKDQSYVLSVLNQEQLGHALFPVGEYTKAEVRGLAEKFDLPVAQVKDSQDLCFLAGTDYGSFLQRNAPEVEKPGPIMTKDDEVIGEHNGLAFYTIGQRKGLGITQPEPLYVIEKDVERNALVVGKLEELGQSELTAGAVNWVSGEMPDAPFKAAVKIRYTAKLAAGLVTPIDENQFKVKFDEPMRDITPGQAAVVYIGDEAVANGIIESKTIPADEIVPVKLIQVTP